MKEKKISLDNKNLSISWISRGGKAQFPANPEFPKGIDIKAPPGTKCCKTSLPYPAEEKGNWVVECSKCGVATMITAAGRTDDPRSVEVICKHVEYMTVEERRVIRSLAKSERYENPLRQQAIDIFRSYLGKIPIQESLEMKFVSEIDSPCPDLALRSIYRKQLCELPEE